MSPEQAAAVREAMAVVAEALAAMARRMLAAFRVVARALGLIPPTIRPGWPPFGEWRIQRGLA